MEKTKFFKMVDSGDPNFCQLFVCHIDTPIPTAKDIVERNELSSFCEDDEVVEITMQEFLELHTALLSDILGNAEDVIEWAPNVGGLTTWEYWYANDDSEF